MLLMVRSSRLPKTRNATRIAIKTSVLDVRSEPQHLHRTPLQMASRKIYTDGQISSDGSDSCLPTTLAWVRLGSKAAMVDAGTLGSCGTTKMKHWRSSASAGKLFEWL
jgi:hypothetical protein